MRGHLRLGLFAVSCLWAAGLCAQDYPHADFDVQQCQYGTAGYTELVPDARTAFGDVVFRDTALSRLLNRNLSGSWARLEYLNYRVSDPERVLLGTPLADVEDPSDPFLVDDTSDVFAHAARVPVLDGIDLTNINGLRGSIGVPVYDGWLEGSAFGLSEATGTAFHDRLPFTNPLGPIGGGLAGDQGITILATTLLTNGTAGDRFLIYDQDFNAIYQSDIWGAEVNYVFDYVTPQMGLTFQPIIGYRHVQYSENMHFGGTFSNVSDFDAGAGLLAAPVQSSIQSQARNSMHGGQLGFRSEFITQYVTLGVEPKVILTSNQVRAHVTTRNLRAALVDDRTADLLAVPPQVRFFSLTDPTRTTHASDSQVSPGFDLGLYAKIHLTNWMNVRVGYNLLWLSNLTTAENNIFYNDDGDIVDDPTNTPGVVVRQNKFSDRYIDGFSIGGEIILP
jgi:hypothetical protein